LSGDGTEVLPPPRYVAARDRLPTVVRSRCGGMGTPPSMEVPVGGGGAGVGKGIVGMLNSRTVDHESGRSPSSRGAMTSRSSGKTEVGSEAKETVRRGSMEGESEHRDRIAV
jgi:hypothetical protein